MLGVKIMSKINNVGVAAELVGVAIIIVLLLVHARRGPQVVFDTQDVDRGDPGHGALGILAPILLAAVMPAYVMFGFDTAGSLAEETTNPHKTTPKALLQALAAAGFSGPAPAALRGHGGQEHQARRPRAPAACRRSWATRSAAPARRSC